MICQRCNKNEVKYLQKYTSKAAAVFDDLTPKKLCEECKKELESFEEFEGLFLFILLQVL